MKHRSYWFLAGLLFLSLAGVIVGFAQAKDVVSTTHSQAVTSSTSSAPATPVLDRCGEPLPTADMSVDPGTAGSPDMTPTACPLRCITPVGYCDDVPLGSDCGVHPACHGKCSVCNGKLDCFSQN